MRIINGDIKSDVAFKTNIILVSPRKFNEIRDVMCYRNAKIIDNFSLRKFTFLPNQQCYRLNSKRILTEGIKTCTGLVVSNPQKKVASIFAHFLHSKNELDNMNLVEKYIKGKNAILIGAKYKYDSKCDTIKVFDAVRALCCSKKLPITEIKGLSTSWEANMAYDGAFDNLFVCIKEISPKDENNPDYVNSLGMLKRKCNKVCISPTDNVKFIPDEKLKFVVCKNWFKNRLSYFKDKIFKK